MKRQEAALYLGISVLLVVAADQVKAEPVQWKTENGGNGHFYDAVAVEVSTTWNDAKLAAESLTFRGVSGHLATITSQQENDFIISNLPDAPNNDYWLGGFQPPDAPEPDGGWQWVTGEPFEFQNWAPAEPNNTLGIEDELAFWNPIFGSWNDSRGGHITGYVVEFVPEPATFTVLALGGLSLLRRRRVA